MKNLDPKIKFEFVKRILTDTIPEIYRNKFFNNSEELTLNDITNAIYNNIDPKRLNGLDWPERAHTMIGMKRLENLQFCINEVIENKIEGDLIETGVWRGGACIFMKYMLDNLDIKHKKVYVADSFIGLPPPDVKYIHDNGDKHFEENFLKVDIETVINNFKMYNVLDNNVKFVKGWFKNTLPELEAEKFCILRLDGDMYESTIQALENLYHKLSVGGYIIIDDYCLKNCVAAVTDFRNKNNIKDPIIQIDSCGIFWKKQ